MTSPGSGSKSIRQLKKVRLTRIKKQIIRLLRKGYSAKVIATQLNRSHRTIEMHINHMYRACAVNSRKEFLDLIHANAYRSYFASELRK